MRRPASFGRAFCPWCRASRAPAGRPRRPGSAASPSQAAACAGSRRAASSKCRRRFRLAAEAEEAAGQVEVDLEARDAAAQHAPGTGRRSPRSPCRGSAAGPRGWIVREAELLDLVLGVGARGRSSRRGAAAHVAERARASPAAPAAPRRVPGASPAACRSRVEEPAEGRRAWPRRARPGPARGSSVSPGSVCEVVELGRGAWMYFHRPSRSTRRSLQPKCSRGTSDSA